MHVRDALTYAARLFRSGYRSDEAVALFALARDRYRLLHKLAAVRADRNAWREQAIEERRRNQSADDSLAS